VAPPTSSEFNFQSCAGGYCGFFEKGLYGVGGGGDDAVFWPLFEFKLSDADEWKSTRNVRMTSFDLNLMFIFFFFMV
jgi:hypothetical protein